MAAGETGRAPESRTGKLRGPRALVASSDATTREFLTRIVRHTGAEVVTADDGVEALGFARQLDLDLVILDAHLGVNDGIAVCGQIRRLSGPQPVIVLAGLTAGRLLERAFETDADDFLVKPLLAGVVHRRVDNLLRQRRTLNELSLLKRAIQVAGNGFTILDARSTEYPVTHVNDAFCKMTGYTRQELMGRNLRMLNGPETDVAAMAQLREAFTRGKEVRVVLKNYRKDGTTFWNELAMAPLRDKAGRLTHWVGIQTDASARIRVDEMASQQREAEQSFSLQLREKNDTLASLETRRRFNEMLLNSITAGIIATDREGRVVFINRAAQEVLQVSLADCLERPLVEIFGDSEDFSRELDDLTEQRWTDFQLISAGGVLLHIGLTIMPAPDEFAGDLGVVVLFRDLGSGELAEEVFAPSQTVGAGAAADDEEAEAAGREEETEPSGPAAAERAAEPRSQPADDDEEFAWEALDVHELIEAAVAGLGWAEGPEIREPDRELAQVWSGREAATAVLMRLLELAHDIAQGPADLRLRLAPAVLGEDEQGPIAGLEIEFRLAQAGAAATRPGDFQARLEEVAEWLHALGGAMLVPESDSSSLVFSAQLPVVQAG